MIEWLVNEGLSSDSIGFFSFFEETLLLTLAEKTRFEPVSHKLIMTPPFFLTFLLCSCGNFWFSLASA